MFIQDFLNWTYIHDYIPVINCLLLVGLLYEISHDIMFTVYILSRRIYIHRPSINVLLFVFLSSLPDDLMQIISVGYTCTSLLVTCSTQLIELYRGATQLKTVLPLLPRHSFPNVLNISMMRSHSLLVHLSLHLYHYEAPRMR